MSLRAEHAVSLTTTCLTIGEDGAIVTLHDIFCKRQGDLCAKARLQSLLVENPVELKPVLQISSLHAILARIHYESRFIASNIIFTRQERAEAHYDANGGGLRRISFVARVSQTRTWRRNTSAS
jgi:hypothetical protein